MPFQPVKMLTEGVTKAIDGHNSPVVSLVVDREQRRLFTCGHDGD